MANTNTLDDRLMKMGFKIPDNMENMDVNERIEAMGIKLPQYPEGNNLFTHVKEFGSNLAYLSGCGPELDGVLKYTGLVNVDVTFEQARECAVACTLNFLRALQLHFGDLNRIKNFVKMTVFVACEHGYKYPPEVADASTELLAKLFGTECGVPARTAIGVSSLPLDFPVEIEVLVELY